jgi:hypothetical protein
MQCYGNKNAFSGFIFMFLFKTGFARTLPFFARFARFARTLPGSFNWMAASLSRPYRRTLCMQCVFYADKSANNQLF